MKDLLLWRALGGRDPLADELVPLLEELAARPPAVRRPFAGRLIRAARDERPRVRAAALAGLAGHDGHEALCAVVRGLDDPVPAVAAVAVENLRAVGSSDPLRIVHAVFHPDPAIRRAGVGDGLPTPARQFLPHLLGDEACVHEVLPLLAEAEALPGFAVPGVLDMLGAGRLSAEAAARLVQRIAPAELLQRIAACGLADAARATPGGHGWSFEQLGELLDSLRLETSRPAPPFAPRGDRLPEIITLLGSVPAAAAAGTPIDRLVRALPAAGATVRRGVAVAAAARLLAAPADDATLIRLLVAAWPAAALWRWLDVRCRRAAVDDFLAIPADRLEARPYGALGDEWLVAIDESDLLRDTPGATADVRALAGVARLVGLEALERVAERFRIEELVAGLRLPRAAPFLTVPGSPDRRYWLVERVRGDERRLWPQRLAHLVPSFNRELLPLLADFTPAETLELLALLQRLDPPADLKDPRGRRVQGVAAEIGRLLAGVPPPSGTAGVQTVGGGPQVGHFLLELGRHAPSAPPAAARTPETFGALLGDFVRQWRRGPRSPIDAFLRIIFLAAIDVLPEEIAAGRLQALDADDLRFLLFEQFADDAIPSRLDAALRVALADRERQPAATLAATVAAAGGIAGGLNRVWAALVGRSAPADEPTGPFPGEASRAACSSGAGIHTLTAVERCRLIDSLDAKISRILRPYANQPTLGLAECLAKRPPSQPRGAEAAAAILMCHDPLPTIDRALSAFVPIVPSVMCDRLDSSLSSRRPGHERLTLHLHAWLWRWERHLEQGLAILAETDQPLAAVVIATHGMTCGPLATRLLEFVRAVLDQCGARDRGMFHVHANKRLADATATALTGPAGPAAAGVFVAWSDRDPGSVILAQARPGVVAMLPHLSRGVRDVLEPWISSRGLENDDEATASTTRRDEFEACLSRGMPTASPDVDRAVECVLGETGPCWFMPADWDRLVAAGIDDRILARRLAVARQPHAYLIALETLLTEPAPTPEDLAAVLAFLEQGDARLADLRLLAARTLFACGDAVGLPLLLADETKSDPRTPRLFVGLDAETVGDAVRSALATKGVQESVLCALLLEPAVAADARAAGLHVLLTAGTSDTVRDRILPRLARSRTAGERIHRVAESFAWGIRRGLELTGKLFTVEMIAGEGLGYTRLHEPRVFVNPLPLLRGERHGEQVVRGLVIHEVGHHVYHADAENLQAAEEARSAGFFSLLNLVQDEHLERNLRAVDPALGDPLKRLAAYAFQHAPRELHVPDLLAALEDQAFVVLTQVRLFVARHAGHVVAQAGRVLRQLENRGHAFPRFVRALRMGLGGRVADARTAEALALFGPGFRHSSGTRLLEIARELRRIFGDEVRLLDLLGGLGTPVSGAPGDAIRAGEGVTDSEIQREVERVLAPPGKKGGGADPMRPGRGRLQINVSPDEEFARISAVEPVPFDPAKSAAYRRRVARPAGQLRRFFERLGFAHQLERQRLQGRFLDRGRLLALAIRGEPRVMVSRRLVPSADLFLGVAVDCSGSMSEYDNIEKARLFAELLAESARGCRGIDVRICGFNDAQILDAGPAVRCAAHNLEVGGGNNDAAGLWHLAEKAFASRRRAKLLVMISDGLPTECSVAALRKLVQVLSHRHGMCCAQVAVRPLEEECFPIHVRLEDDDLGLAVTAFGKTVMRLVQRAIGAGG